MPRIAPPRPNTTFAHQLITRHFAPFPPAKLVTTSRYFPDRLKVELGGALAALTGEVGPEGFTGLYFRGEPPGSFSGLLVDDEEPVRAAAAHFEEVDLGTGEKIRCLRNGLWLGGLGGENDGRYAAVYAYESSWHGETMLRLEVAVLPGAAGESATRRILAAFDQALAEARVYRGRMLTFERDQVYGHAGVSVLRAPAVARGQVILPEATLELIDRNILRFAAQRAALAAHGLPVKKGVLFYGPPGTGKTHTIGYIASSLPDTTTVVVTVEELAHLREHIAFARKLQPAIVVLEDVDLVAEDRSAGAGPGAHALLNRLLNEMDGLREDAQILFILTTNRPEVLEPALTARPGRIDQAIEFPLPDEACRARLLRLYAAKLRLAGETVAEVARRAKGCTASTIKELVRRAAQMQFESGGGADIGPELFARALEEMTLRGGKLNAKLLGVAPDAPGFVRAA